MPAEITDLVMQDFALYLNARGKSKRTVRAYLYAVGELQRTYDIPGTPVGGGQDWAAVTKRQVRRAGLSGS
jgi:hypothetical protein